MRGKMRAVVMLVVAFATSAHARPYDVDGVAIEVPSPVGFTTTSAYPALYRKAEQVTAPQARLLDHYLPRHAAPQDVNASAWNGKSWMLVQTPRGAASIELTPERFEKLKAGTRVVNQTTINQRYPGVLKQAGVDEMKLMGVNEDTPEWFMFSSAAKSEGESVPTIHVTSYCRIKGKLVILGAYRVFQSSEDIRTLQRDARTWALSVLNANR